jgi:transposase-like protein
MNNGAKDIWRPKPWGNNILKNSVSFDQYLGMEQEPKILQEAVIYFSNPVIRREYAVRRRWPNGVTCPMCGSAKVRFSEKQDRWQCGSHHSKRQFTVKTGTIFGDSPLGLDKWLVAMWLVVNCRNGISSHEIGPTSGNGMFFRRSRSFGRRSLGYFRVLRHSISLLG